MARHNDLGKWGESLAVDRLIEEGFSIIETNWRLGHLEIDIIARKDNMMVFAEVKTRSDNTIDPLEAIDDRKRANMVRAADAFMRHTGKFYEARFDVFGITGTPDDYNMEHIPDAFYPTLKTY